VTRREIAEAVGAAFTLHSVGRDEILTSAQTSGASADVLAQLDRLADRSYSDLRQLWSELPELPVG
jgi:hypothetical protein